MWKLLQDSNDLRRSNNGGEYAKGYKITATSTGCTVAVDRAYGSDYEGEHIHCYELPTTPEHAETLVKSHADLFAEQFHHKTLRDLAMRPKLHKALVRLQKEGALRPSFGICFNTSLYYYDVTASPWTFGDVDGVYETIANESSRWPMFSGDFWNPVGDLDDDTRGIWDNPRRHDLLAFLIQELSK